ISILSRTNYTTLISENDYNLLKFFIVSYNPISNTGLNIFKRYFYHRNSRKFYKYYHTISLHTGIAIPVTVILFNSLYIFSFVFILFLFYLVYIFFINFLITSNKYTSYVYFYLFLSLLGSIIEDINFLLFIPSLFITISFFYLFFD
ncbi:MAG: hypothetical protein K2X69_05880, partial [Silvanigrellaceae bacterium]|nr:hypothetical protein [Silvanigrellaceae bacterium]